MRTAMHITQGPRENVEDCGRAFAIVHDSSTKTKIQVLTVFDGVGGHSHGEIASLLASQHVASFLATFCLTALAEHDRIAPDRILETMVDALHTANDLILQKSASDATLRGMATTAVCALVVSDIVYVVWVGDSRCYVVGDDSIRRLTGDHSEVEELIDLGVISPEEAHEHPCAHTITQWLGKPKGICPGTRMSRLTSNDMILLCTDGLTDVVSDQAIARAVSTCRRGDVPFERLPRHLADEALRLNTRDNVTVLCATPRSRGDAAPITNLTATGAYPVHLARSLQRMQQECNDGT